MAPRGAFRRIGREEIFYGNPKKSKMYGNSVPGLRAETVL